MITSIASIPTWDVPALQTLTIVGSDGIAVTFDRQQVREQAPNLCVMEECSPSSLFTSTELRYLNLFLRTGSVADAQNPPPLERILGLIDFSGAQTLFKHLLHRDLATPAVTDYFQFALRPELAPTYKWCCIESLTDGDDNVKVNFSETDLNIIVSHSQANPGRTLNALKAFLSLVPKLCVKTVSLRFADHCTISSDEFRSIIDHLGSHTTLLRTILCRNLTRADLEYASARCPLEYIEITPCEADLDFDGREPDKALLSTQMLASLIEQHPNLKSFKVNRRYDVEDTTELLNKILACCTQLETLELKCQGLTPPFLNAVLARNPNLRVLTSQTTDPTGDFRLLNKDLIASHENLRVFTYWDGYEQIDEFNAHFQGIANKSITMYRYWTGH